VLKYPKYMPEEEVKTEEEKEESEEGETTE